MIRTACFATVAALALASSLAAHEGATGVVKERMDAMAAMAKSMKSIGQRIKNNRDLGAIKEDAQAMLPLASNILPLFPKGSNQHPSEAKADIWQNWSDFQNKAHALETEIGKLSTVDTSDRKVVSAQVRAVTQVCGRCHELYRQKERGGTDRHAAH